MDRRKLSLQDLVVESFQTDEAHGARGTVKAHDYSEACYTDEFNTCPNSCGGTCEPEYTCGTCAISCGGTCHTCPESCWGTCAAEYTCGGQFSCDVPACTHQYAHC